LNTTATAAALILAAASIATTTAASAAPFPACTARQLHLSLGHARAATGHVTETLTATDEGPACVLSGFPKLGLENARHEHLYSVTSRTGRRGTVLVLYKLSARAQVSYGSDGVFDAVPATYLTVGGKAVRFPGGIAWVYGGQLTVTTWTLPKAQQ
jgi:hypothetical protein